MTESERNTGRRLRTSAPPRRPARKAEGMIAAHAALTRSMIGNPAAPTNQGPRTMKHLLMIAAALRSR